MTGVSADYFAADQASFSDIVAELTGRPAGAAESPEGVDTGVWRALVDSDTGLLLPGPEERSRVMEALGAGLARLPFLGHHGLAMPLLREIGCPDVMRRLRADRRTAAVAIAVDIEPWRAPVDAFTLRPNGLHGAIGPVADATIADVLLVPCRGALYLVDRWQSGVTVESVDSADRTRPLSAVTLDGARADLLADRAGGPLRALLIQALSLLASEQVGVARRALDSAFAWLDDPRRSGPVRADRRQRLADLRVRVATARATARYAVAQSERATSDAELTGFLALSVANETAVAAAREYLELLRDGSHGGEGPARLLLERATCTAKYFGGTAALRGRVAALSTDRPARGGRESR